METYEMRYFLATAEYQSVGKAAARLAVSAPAVSRAIARVEEELGVQLFDRVGRNIVLTAAGKQLQGEVSRILSDLDEIKLRFKPSNHHIAVAIKGTEFGLSTFSSKIVTRLKRSKLAFSLEVKVGESSNSVERSVLDGDSHLGIITTTPSNVFRHQLLGQFESKTYVGPGHKLYGRAKKKERVSIKEVLEHEFASFLEPVFFEAKSIETSSDGWRDDKFRRKVAFRTESIESAIASVESGAYLCYLPEPLAMNRALLPLHVDGCPYRCETKVFLIAKKDQDLSWMRSLFE